MYLSMELIHVIYMRVDIQKSQLERKKELPIGNQAVTDQLIPDSAAVDENKSNVDGGAAPTKKRKREEADDDRASKRSELIEDDPENSDSSSVYSLDDRHIQYIPSSLPSDHGIYAGIVDSAAADTIEDSSGVQGDIDENINPQSTDSDAVVDEQSRRRRDFYLHRNISPLGSPLQVTAVGGENDGGMEETVYAEHLTELNSIKTEIGVRIHQTINFHAVIFKYMYTYMHACLC